MVRGKRKQRAFMACVLLFLICLLSACGGAIPDAASDSPGIITVVAAENFYGNIAQQLGGNHVSVTSILTNPNVDPHEYESNVQAAITVSKAALVIENGDGYDDWMDKLLAAAPNSNRLLIEGYGVATTHLPENEHVWYSFDNIAAIAQAITNDLKQLDPANSATFENNLQKFKQSLQPLQQKIAAIKAKYAGTPVGLTETIYLYQAVPEGLNVLTPFAFEQAIAEGNDPSAGVLTTTTDQINNRHINILIYNEQTITPVTTNLENLARSKGIPIVPVSETMPPGKTYQSWMMDQLNVLETALASSESNTK